MSGHVSAELTSSVRTQKAKVRESKRSVTAQRGALWEKVEGERKRECLVLLPLPARAAVFLRVPGRGQAPSIGEQL